MSATRKRSTSRRAQLKSAQDVCLGNMLAANSIQASVHKQLIADRLYIIDFGQSRQLPLGPGVQRAITLPETQMSRPNDLLHFDPYSWDVYCVGRTMDYLLKVRYSCGLCRVTTLPLRQPRCSMHWDAKSGRRARSGLLTDSFNGSWETNGAARVYADAVRQRVQPCEC